MEPGPKKIGYARVSTEDQSVNLQLDALNEIGCDEIFKDEGVSGSVQAKQRPGFNNALCALKAGDTLVLWKLDRAFRSTMDAIQTLYNLKEQGVEFKCITMHIDTTTPEGRKWYRDTASWCEYEREVISQRTMAGLQAAKKRGARLGRRRKMTGDQISHARDLLERQGKSFGDVSKLMGISKTTVWRSLQ